MSLDNADKVIEGAPRIRVFCESVGRGMLLCALDTALTPTVGHAGAFLFVCGAIWLGVLIHFRSGSGA